MSTNKFSKTKETNPREKCQWGQSTINSKEKGHKICCFKNFSSLLENYISGAIQFAALGEEIIVEEVNGEKNGFYFLHF